MKIPTDQLVSELKTQPYTLVVVLALCAFAIWSYMTHADEAVKTKTVESRLAAVERRVTQNGAAIDNVLALSIASEIRTQHELYCASDTNGRRAIQRTMDNLQNDYQNLKAAYLPLGDCINGS